MAYSVTKKKQQRAEDRAVEVGGDTYPPKPYTVALDQELYALSEKLGAAIDAHDKLVEEYKALEENATAKKRAAVQEKLSAASAAITRVQIEQIVARLGPSETDGVVSADLLERELEIEDVNAILAHLRGENEMTLGGPGPTGTPSSE